VKLVLASNNAKKLAELAALFSPLTLELVTQGSLGVAEVDEPHHTFIENALVKARNAARTTGVPALADDSGLCVDALGGAPGVQSAHYATFELPHAAREQRRALQDRANNALLLERLASAGNRRARFVSVLVALRSADDPEPLVAAARWEGEILVERRGGGGFGYDPLMFIPSLGRTVAELDAATKNAHSHRAQAARQMVRLMQESWHLG